MIALLSKIFLKNKQNDRTALGTLCGWLGIFLNVLLSVFKIVASLISGSVSIMADAVNNLSDAGSSLVTILGFRLSSKKPDKDHPFGHGRIEYISAFIVALLICLMGFELGKSSIEKIISGEGAEFSAVSVIVLSLAILVKLYMFVYNRGVGKKIKSEALLATANDSLSDCIATGAVLLCTVLAKFIAFPLDGWCGLLVALLILRAGITTAKDTIEPLLGKAPEKELVDKIRDIVMGYDLVTGVHDLIVHDYGPGRLMITLHAEVPVESDINDAHDVIDNIEERLSSELSCLATIHMDPVSTGKETLKMKETVLCALKTAIHPDVLIHDVRIVEGTTHTNIIFDAVIPYESGLSDDEARKKAAETVKTLGANLNPVITIDRPYANSEGE